MPELVELGQAVLSNTNLLSFVNGTNSATQAQAIRETKTHNGSAFRNGKNTSALKTPGLIPSLS